MHVIDKGSLAIIIMPYFLIERKKIIAWAQTLLSQSSYRESPFVVSIFCVAAYKDVGTGGAIVFVRKHC